MQTALVIEDNEDNMVLITTLLRKAGYRSLEAETGLQGYKLAIEACPDFILLDIQLSDIDGTEVVRRLRDTDATRHIPVIAITSYAMSGDRERLLAAGCDGYLEKPINPRLVISQIQRILGEDAPG